MYLLLFIFGTLAGISTVLFGFGGGFVTVPVLYSLLTVGFPPDSPVARAAMQIAVATSTAAMIFGSAMSTMRHHRAGTLQWAVIRPLIGYIALGAIVGAALASSISGGAIKWLFVGYLALTIVDSTLRPGFMASGDRPVAPMSALSTAGAGMAIGLVAALLGVGGSVMTVPLMRRRGASMTAATGMASPLSLPMAVTGTATYVLAAWHIHPLGPWFAGFVDMRAFALLVAGSWLGIRVSTRWIGKIPDAVHAKIYPVLLAAVLVVMLVI